jgi:colicin import membrane protein
VVKPAKQPEVVKPVPAKEAPPKPSKETAATDSVAQALAKFEANKARQELSDKIATLTSKDTRGKGTDAPVGMPDAKGTQAGIPFETWLETYLRDRWHFPTQLTARCDLEAVVEIVFDPQGRRVSERIIRKSGEETFDESVLRAVLKLKELPNPPDERLRIQVPFNLKDTPQCKK